MSSAPPPKCPKCGRQMRLASWRPGEKGNSSVQGFKCDPCGVEIAKSSA